MIRWDGSWNASVGFARPVLKKSILRVPAIPLISRAIAVKEIAELKLQSLTFFIRELITRAENEKNETMIILVANL